MEITIPTWLTENLFLTGILSFIVLSYCLSPKLIRKFLKKYGKEEENIIDATIFYIFSPCFMLIWVIVKFFLLFGYLELIGKKIMKEK